LFPWTRFHRAPFFNWARYAKRGCTTVVSFLLMSVSGTSHIHHLCVPGHLTVLFPLFLLSCSRVAAVFPPNRTAPHPPTPDVALGSYVPPLLFLSVAPIFTFQTFFFQDSPAVSPSVLTKGPLLPLDVNPISQLSLPHPAFLLFTPPVG